MPMRPDDDDDVSMFSDPRWALAYGYPRYEVTTQRVDDMLMVPIPLNNVKGYSLEVHPKNPNQPNSIAYLYSVLHDSILGQLNYCKMNPTDSHGHGTNHVS